MLCQGFQAIKFFLIILSELGSGWDFLGIGIRDRDFFFELHRKIPKIPKSRGSGSRFENSEKIPREKTRKSQNPGDRDFKTSKKSRKSRRWGVIFPGYPEVVSPKS